MTDEDREKMIELFKELETVMDDMRVCFECAQQEVVKAIKLLKRGK